MNSAFEVLDAFVDGETVDPAALKRALADPAGRDYFVDAWLIRDGMTDEIAAAAVHPAASAPQPAPRSGVPRSLTPRRPWFLATAAGLVCLAAGYAIGLQLPLTRPAAPVASGSTPVIEAPPAPATSFPVPAPTRVIRVELTSDAVEAGGGG